MSQKKQVAATPLPAPFVPVGRHVALLAPGPALPFRRRVQRRARIARVALHTYGVMCVGMVAGMFIIAVGLSVHG